MPNTGSVSDLLVEGSRGFVHSLKSQEVNLPQFQEQVPHIKQTAGLGLYPFDGSVGRFYSCRVYLISNAVYNLVKLLTDFPGKVIQNPNIASHTHFYPENKA